MLYMSLFAFAACTTDPLWKIAAASCQVPSRCQLPATCCRFPDFSILSPTHDFTSVIDAVFISHFHLDHIGALPFFTEVGLATAAGHC